MTLELMQILTIAAIVISLGALVLAVLAFRNLRGPGTAGRQKLESTISALRTDIEALRDRDRMLEERFERYDRTQIELRDSTDRMREDFDGRMSHAQSQDAGQKALQEQILEIRKEHQVLMERGDRHDRRVSELQEQLGNLSAELTTTRSDGVRAKR